MPKPPREDPVSRIPGVRASVTELVILALALAFAVNLLTDAFVQSVPRWVVVVVGFTVCIASIGFVIRTRLRPAVHTTCIPGFFVYDRETHDLIEVPEYDLAEDAVQFLAAAFAENPALRRQWDSQSLVDDPAPRHGAKPGPARQLLLELMEYILLHRLSLALSEHFNSTEFARAKLRTYRRNDIPDILLKNRFLDLFSRDIADRPGFDEPLNNSEEGWELVATSGDGGAYYSRFDLTLPADSRITRAADGELLIEGPSVSLRIATDYDGFHASVPFSLPKLYLHEANLRWDPLAVDFLLTITVRRQWFLRGEAIRYNAWVEKVLDDLTGSLSGEAFVERIQWPLLESAVRIFKPRRLYEPRTTAPEVDEARDDGTAFPGEGAPDRAL